MKYSYSLNKFWNRSGFFYKARYAMLLKKIKPNELQDLYYNNYNQIKTIPQIYFEVNKKIFETKYKPETDFDKALQIATWLRQHIKGGKGLGLSSDKTLKYMLKGGFGICSDFCQIFNNFCVINHIKVREWGLLNFENKKEGHAFNEFYAKELKKWVLIDVSNSIYFTSDPNLNNPMSVSDVFNFSKLNKGKQMVNYNSGFKPKDKTIRKYYYSKKVEPFVVDKYRNKFYDSLLNNLGFLPIPFIHGLAILLNKSYVYKKIPLKS